MIRVVKKLKYVLYIICAYNSTSRIRSYTWWYILNPFLQVLHDLGFEVILYLVDVGKWLK